MKRVKSMFIAIAIIAFAAGTLAFKARYGFTYCTTAATTTLLAGQHVYTCTYKLGPFEPATTLSCPNITFGKLTSPHAQTATICTTAPTIDIEGVSTCANRICTTPTTKLTVE